MNFQELNFSEPYRSRLVELIRLRDEATNPRDKSWLNKSIRSVRMEHARSIATHTPEQWELLKRQLGGRCVMCGVYGTSIHLEKDHVKPIYQGGSDGIDNLQPLCASCNASKGPDSMNWAQYRLQKGFES